MRSLALAPLLMACAMPVLAERGDREKPITLEANRISVDDVRKVQAYEGNVVMTQGTLSIRTDKLIVMQDADGFQKGIAQGGPGGLARFRQKREGKDEFIEGEAERIEHNARNDTTEFFVRAMVRSGLDEIKGNFISYDGLNERYQVTSGVSSDGKGPGKVEGGRVRAILQPKGKGETPAAPGAPLPLKPAGTLPPKE